MNVQQSWRKIAVFSSFSQWHLTISTHFVYTIYKLHFWTVENSRKNFTTSLHFPPTPFVTCIHIVLIIKGLFNLRILILYKNSITMVAANIKGILCWRMWDDAMSEKGEDYNNARKVLKYHISYMRWALEEHSARFLKDNPMRNIWKFKKKISKKISIYLE